MSSAPDPGMHLSDLRADIAFASRPPRARDPMQIIAALRRVAHVFARSPESVLQELVEIAVQYTAAESAGISLDESADPDHPSFRWIAVAGTFAAYVNGTTSDFHSPSGICIDRGVPQLFRAPQPYYDQLGINAREITDGILIPWNSTKLIDGEARGTLWAVAHSSAEAFDAEDFRLLESLADFAAIAVRHNRQHQLMMTQARYAAAGEMANRLAHRINNPLQCLTNTLFLASQPGADSHLFAQQASDDLARLSELVGQLLSLNYKQN